MDEKRRHIRVGTDAVVLFDPQLGRLIGSSRIIDISEGGICICSKKLISINTMIEIEIRADDIKEPIKTSAQVRRVKHCDDTQFELGLEFLNLTSTQWKMLRQHVHSRMAR